MTLRVCRCLQRGPATQSSAVHIPYIHIPAAHPPAGHAKRQQQHPALDLQPQKQRLWEVRTVFTEASVIPGTVFDLRFRVDVQEWAFLVTAFPCTKGKHTSQSTVQV